MEFDYGQQPGLTRWNQGLVNTEAPLVSIITPFYNSGTHLQQTCNCVLDQTFPYFEWIIVDDGSTKEEEVRCLEEIAAQDPRIRVLHKENGGPSSARNYAVQHSRADLILPLDADDLLEPTFVEYCWWMLQKNPGAAWAFADCVGFQGQEYLWAKPFDPLALKRENQLVITALIRKDVFLEIGGYREEPKHFNEDWYSWLQIVARGGYPAQCTGEYLFWYRRSGGGELSSILNNRETAAVNKRMIDSAAAQVANPKPGVIYPKPFSYNWTQPRMSAWEKCVYSEKTRKHIVFLFPHLVMGGADKFNFDLISGLDREQFDTSIITTVESPNHWLQQFRKVTPNIFNLPNFAEPEDYGEFISYYLISRKADVLFVSNSYHGYYLIPWLREHFPELAIVDYVHMEEWYWRNGGYARTSAMVGGITEKTYVCNSATEEVLVSHFGRKPETVKTVHIGVDQAYYHRELAEPGGLCRELGISSARPIVLFICRLHPQKRPFLMLEIAKRVAARLPDVAFAVVGGGPQEPELRRKARKMGLENNVFFLPSRKDVRSCYRDAKLTLVCSLKEGLSLTAYESCSMGVPVVSADVGGQRDLIDDAVGALIPCKQEESDSLDARSFAQEEVEAYVSSIVTLLTDERRWAEASANCRSRILDGFTIQSMVEYFQQEFRRLTTEEAAKQQRRQVSRALALCSPLAAELAAVEMQMHVTDIDFGNRPKSLTGRIKRVLQEEGFRGFVKKVLRRAKQRAKNVTSRICHG